MALGRTRTGNEAGITAASPKGTRTDAMSGGIVGAAFNGGKIQDCENMGIISSNAANGTKYWVSSCAGGIVGAAGLSKITDCINREIFLQKAIYLYRAIMIVWYWLAVLLDIAMGVEMFRERILQMKFKLPETNG